MILGVMAVVGLSCALMLLQTAQKQNSTADITDYALTYAELPKGFDGMLVAHISDYHGDSACREQILHSLAQRKPDLIAITGDLLDPGVEEESLDFAAQLVGIAPTYFVTGNHEARMDNYVEMEMRLRTAGVCVLRNETMQMERNGDTMTIAGADDEDMETEPDLAKLCAADGFVLLLSHRPEYLDKYAAAGPELVLCGHAHGGQIRIPGTEQGLIAHGQDLIPKYTQGVHKKDGTTMVISRGIANVYFPPRLFNPPELVYITLNCA